MSAAAPLSLSDPFAWLPPHMRAPARAARFGLLGHAELRVLHVDGHRWYSDGGAFVSSGLEPEAGESTPPRSHLVAGYALSRHAEPVDVVDEGDTVLVGPDAPADGWSARPARIPAYQHGMVMALWPTATWEIGHAYLGDRVSRYAVAVVDGRPVAMVMPILGMASRRAA